ncbi:MAG: serine aminopeptidase domain-containing protein [Thermoguttaceae bacterium]
MLPLVGPAQAEILDQDAAIKLGHQYLAADSRTERRRLAALLADYQGDIEPVLKRLSTQKHQTVKAGLHPAKHFISGELRKRHPEDLLYFVVPEGYRPERSSGLIIFLHGGGRKTSRNAPQSTLSFPDKNTPRYSSRSGDLFAATGMITVGPSAPWNTHCYHRWCLPEADQYLADVILECKGRFNIDPDRVFLIGHSMGGFGAYQHVQRQPDRWAAVAVSSGSWTLGYWPAIRGTPLWFIQGTEDARPGVRWHYTDIEYGRWTDKILTREALEHRYLERPGAHGFGYARKQVTRFLAAARTLRRDPYYPRVALATPAGYRSSCCYPLAQNRWLTLDKTVRGDLAYDELVTHGEDHFDTWRLEHRIGKHRGAAVEALNRGDNTIAVTTRNVARFTVWLHPRMVDLAKPVSIVVDGKVRFHERVKPSLAVALESYRRRSDWGLVYPIKIELSVPPESK